MKNEDLNKFHKYIQSNQINEAEKEINRLLYLYPDNFLILNHQAFLLYLKNNFQEAINKFKKSISLNENFFQNYFDISLCFINLKMKNEAIFYLKKYINYKQDNCDAYNNLGVLYLEDNKLDDAASFFNKCISLKLDYVKAYNNLAVTLFKKNNIDSAINIIELGIKIDPTFSELYLNLARCYGKKNYYFKAIKILKNLIKNNPNDNIILALLGDYYIATGRIMEGFYFIDKSLKLKDNPKLYETKLLAYFYQEDLDLDSYYKDIAKLKKIYNKNNINRYEKKKNYSYKKMKIGFISADLKLHAVSFQIFDVVKNLSENLELELFLYYNEEFEDEITESFKKLNINWRNIFNLTDEDVIESLNLDNIQILIDLSGFSKGCRPKVFYYKPCPIQISWAGYLASTGMEQIDYIFADKHTIPKQDESMYVEKIFRLDKTWTVLSKNYNVKVNGNLPASQNNKISFGSFNNILKINRKVIGAWSKILCNVNNSKLYLFSKNFYELEFNNYFKKLFFDNGVKSDQLIFGTNLSRDELLNRYNIIDIALDTFPYSGGTTSLESYWMAVPVLTKKGNYFISKSTESINKNIGLSDWIANDENDYIDKAISFSNNLIFLQSVKTYLFKNRHTFSIFNSKDFAKEMYKSFKNLISQ